MGVQKNAICGKTAPAAFQRMMNNVLSGLTHTRYFVFLDIVMYANSSVDHDKNKGCV
jgi:hypothetical protein